MDNWRIAKFVVILILDSTRSSFTSSLHLDIVNPHCSQIARNSMYSTPRTIIPEPSNASEIFKPSMEAGHINIDLCPDRRILKLTWSFNKTQRFTAKLCYRIKPTESETTMTTACYRLHFHQSSYAVLINCWFPMEFVDSKHVITAWTESKHAQIPSFYGRLDTSALDPENTCKDVCEVVAMDIGSQIYCHDSASIFHDTTTVVKRLSFDAIDETICMDAIKTFKQYEGHLDYHLSCSYEGTGYIKVLYSTHGKFCLKYQMVNVLCPNASKIAITNRSDDTHSFGAFLVFGAVCFVVIASTFFTIVFVAQWLYDRSHVVKYHHRRHSDSQHRRYSDHHLRHFSHIGQHHVNMKREECFPLNTFRPQPSGSKPITSVTTADVYNSVKQPTRQRSASMTSEKMPEEENEKLRLLTLPMRRSITMALLEETDPFYKKRILFLPIPFDHYTNEVVKILKSVFIDEGGIPSQCCFDRKIYQGYMESDPFKWIETVLSDHDKILIFLCFTSLNVERTAKRESMAEFILENLLFTKVKSHRLCKVILLHLIDSPENVREHDIGNSFHICDHKSYQVFVKDVLKFCGRNPDECPDISNRLSNCKASKHFLSFIGIK